MTMATTTTATYQPKLWTPGDWNAFFGFGTNILVNMLVLTGLLRFVLKMPDSLVFGRILPALGLMMCLSTFYYAWLAYRLAKETGRDDVCALPSGVSVPHMFVVTFVIMLPITLKTGDPLKGWSAGLVWVFFQSFILMLGGFIAPYIRKITPRAALLGALAGISITFISMRPALEMVMTPAIGLLCFAIILAAWFGGYKYPKAIPAGLVAIAAGMLIAWGATLFGSSYGGMSVAKLGEAFANFGFSVPLPAFGAVFSGFEFLGIILVTAIPFGIYDLVEAMDNVESAEAAGDAYPTTRVLTADGVVSLIGCLMGNPFINAVYIGHPGWKAMGGRIGYSAATGVMVIVLSWFGVIAVMSALIPLVAISPILLYIGMLIGAQAFQETPKHHAPAIVLALIPNIAAWGKLQIDSALGAAGTNAAAVGFDKLGQVGVLYQGLEVLAGGAILAGMILGAIAAFVIDREYAEGRGLRGSRRGAHLLRLHAWRNGRLRGHAGGRACLCDGGGVPLCAEPDACRGGPADDGPQGGTGRIGPSTPIPTLPARERIRAEPAVIETGAAILAAHRAGAEPAQTVARAYARIRAHNDPAIFITVREEADAIAEAKALAAKGDTALPLYGVPFAVKDNIDVAGLPTTAACPAFAYTAKADATCVARLRAAGAIPIGKTNLDQFATGLVGVRSPYGVPRNVFDAKLIPGGSSSGSAVAVAAGLVPFSLGTDTAGSGRVPAALGNIVGLKPSLGVISTAGVVPACRTLDCVSVFALTVDEAWATLAAMAGPDVADPYMRNRALGVPGPIPPNLRIGVPIKGERVFFGDQVSAAKYEAAIARFAKLGGTITEIDIEPFYETGDCSTKAPGSPNAIWRRKR